MLHLVVLRFSNKRCVVGEADLEVCSLFAFSVSAFQREKLGSDPSHSCYRYTGRSGVRGRGFNNIAFLGFGVLSAQGAQGD